MAFREQSNAILVYGTPRQHELVDSLAEREDLTKARRVPYVTKTAREIELPAIVRAEERLSERFSCKIAC